MKLAALGAFMAMITVIVSAAGSHIVLSQAESEKAFRLFRTAIIYLMFHSIAVIVAGYIYSQYKEKTILVSIYLLAIGSVLFGSSLLELSFTGSRLIPMQAPVGGTTMIIGWAVLAIALFRIKK